MVDNAFSRSKMNLRKRFTFLGIYTGSVYLDETFEKGGFKGEGRINGSVVVVKTHYPEYQIEDDERHLDKVNLFLGIARCRQ